MVKVLQGNIMQPLWLEYPTLSRYSIHWRMGEGEDYKWKFYEWYSSLSLEKREEYKRQFPPSNGWEDFYEFLE